MTLANTGNNYTGTTQINSGTLQIGDGGSNNGSIGSGSVVDNTALVFNQSSNYATATTTVLAAQALCKSKALASSR